MIFIKIYENDIFIYLSLFYKLFNIIIFRVKLYDIYYSIYKIVFNLIYICYKNEIIYSNLKIYILKLVYYIKIINSYIITIIET